MPRNDAGAFVDDVLAIFEATYMRIVFFICSAHVWRLAKIHLQTVGGPYISEATTGMAASLAIEPADLRITDELHQRIAHHADYQREKLAIPDLDRHMPHEPA